MAERNDKFWISQELKLNTFESKWYNEIVNEKTNNENYGLSGCGDYVLEKTVGNHLALVGPMIDGYLREVGKAFMGKLARGNLTGLAPPFTIYIPKQVMRYMVGLCTGYGADIKIVNADKVKKEKLIIFIENETAAKKIFNTNRFDGTNYLAKRMFKKVLNPDTKKTETKYAGLAKVVLGCETPIRFDYIYHSQRMTVTFFIQRYNADDMVVDTSLQKTMNNK